MKNKSLFCFGLGFSALTTARLLLAQGWQVAGTVRSQEKAHALAKEGIRTFVVKGDETLSLEGHDQTIETLAKATHVLQSVPLVDCRPEEPPLSRRDQRDWKDPIYEAFFPHVADARPDWFAYLSTTVVYGNHDGRWVDESTPVAPTGKRGQRRVAAERQWIQTGLPCHIFRIAGIYGPGRNALVSLAKSKARRLNKPGQVFSRIHVEDIAQSLVASMLLPQAKPFEPVIYNLCDDLSAPPQDVIAYAADLLGQEAPPLIPFDEADLTPMARTFYQDNKRVSNRKIREELDVTLKYPTYKEGLQALAKDPF